jgi:hypothetical protein
VKGELGTSMAVLDGTGVTEAQLRSACTVLAGQALDIADGDWAAAKTILGPVLEIVGAVPYDTAIPRGWTGRPVQFRDNGARR